MNIRLHPHAEQRITERGATVSEVVATVLGGWLVLTVIVKYF